MGTKGPIPKRSDQRVRRNKSDVGLAVVQAIGSFKIPELGLGDPHPLVADLYASLRHSAQSDYYEPSDWQQARLVCLLLDDLLKSGRMNGQVLSVVHSMMGELLMSEGARRRVRLEVERAGQAAEVVDVAEMFRQRMMGAGG
ncbi:phage terminase small subunit [Nocardia sp. IFM 10818]